LVAISSSMLLWLHGGGVLSFRFKRRPCVWDAPLCIIRVTGQSAQLWQQWPEF
jgi:hypothetical protein